MKKDLVITFGIIILVIILAYGVISLRNRDKNVDEEVVKCIGEKAILYTQLGCHACIAQEDLFGDNYQYLNVVDCFYEREKCEEIRVTPTWKIGEDLIEGVNSFEKLRELTGC